MSARTALALALGALACDAPTGEGGTPPVALVGQWKYSAVQTSPTPATLAGTLTITRQSGQRLDGSLDATETDEHGAMRQLGGVVSGRALDSTSVDFDAFFEIVGRRHVGTVARDSIRGTWVEQGSAGTSSGSFTAAREAVP